MNSGAFLKFLVLVNIFVIRSDVMSANNII